MPSGENNRKLSDAQVDELVQQYLTRLPDGTWKGATLLAREFGVSQPVVSRWLRIRGVSIRSAQESHSGGKACKPVKNLPVGEPPVCKCACGQLTAWNRRKNRWNVYVPGHYVGSQRVNKGNTGGVGRGANKGRADDLLYKDRVWLDREYTILCRSSADIARQFGVSSGSVRRYLDKFSIPRIVDNSRKGRSGPDNAAWRGGVSEFEYCSDWKALARSIRQRDKYTCQDCGECRKNWGIALHVHHIDWDKQNNDRSNLVSLCTVCHRVRHGGKRLPKTQLGKVPYAVDKTCHQCGSTFMSNRYDKTRHCSQSCAATCQHAGLCPAKGVVNGAYTSSL